MIDVFGIIAESFFNVFKPDSAQEVSDWADKKRFLSSKASAEAGEWRTSRTPYLRQPMNDLSVSSDVQELILIFGSQLGKSESGNNWMGYLIDQSPSPILMVQPTVDIAKRYSIQRIAPMIKDSPCLSAKIIENKSRDSQNTILSKEFPGGQLILCGANSAAGLKSMPIKNLFADEIDTYPADVDGEGDPIELARARTRNFNRRKMLFTSTPTIKGKSRIESLFLDTDQNKYFVPCPHCGHMDNLRWENFIIPKNASGEKDWREAHMVCVDCGGVIEDWHKTEMLAGGEWRATELSKVDSKRKGYHLSALYSPVGWFSWSDIARKWLEAQGNILKLKEFVNTVLAETWEDKGERVSEHDLIDRCENIDPYLLPYGCHLVTIGADVQKNYIELEYVGWGRGEESWSLGYERITGDPTEDSIWANMDILIQRQFQHKSGQVVRAVRIFVDSGNGNHMQRIYDYTRPRKGLDVYACKGSSQDKAPICGPQSIQTKNEVTLYSVGTVSAKDLIFGRMAIYQDGPGKMHFPTGRAKEWFEMLTAEEAKTIKGKKTYRKIRPRNEALDCRVYATAALYSIGVKIDEIADAFENYQNLPKTARTIREIEN